MNDQILTLAKKQLCVKEEAFKDLYSYIIHAAGNYAAAQRGKI
jgi:hypothetical protein